MHTYLDNLALDATQQRRAGTQVIGSLFYPIHSLHIDPPKDEHPDAFGFPIRIQGQQLGALSLMEVLMDIDRPSSSVANACKRGPVFFSFMMKGHALLCNNGREAEQRPGDILVWDSSLPIHWKIASGLHTVVAKVPHRLLLAHGMRADRCAAGLVRAGSPMATLVGQMFLGLTQLDDLPSDSTTAWRLSASMLDAIVSAFEVHDAATPFRASSERLQEVKKFMLGRLDDSDLNVELIAEAMGLSTRTLNRLFAASCSTPMRWLWQQRVEEARRLLMRQAGTRIADAALACGFSNFSHFSQAFRESFGITPSEFIRRLGVR